MTATREASAIQEKRVSNKLGGFVTPNSGAGYFKKGDIQIPNAGLLVECKTCIVPKKSFSIKKEWLEKNKQELFGSGLSNSIIAFNFGYEEKDDYYVIDDKLMKFLVESLEDSLKAEKF